MRKKTLSPNRRREFIYLAGWAPLVAAAGCGSGSGSRGRPAQHAGSDPDSAGPASRGIAPVQDLMREHGLLDRLLLVYEASLAKLQHNRRLDPQPLHDAATIVREFVEQYHEKQEEKFVFPRLKQAGTHSELVNILERQHHAGRRITTHILGATTMGKVSNRDQLAQWLQAYVHMYRPHSAREDTVVFPAFDDAVTATEMQKLSKAFEDFEHQRLGEGAFERYRARIADIETQLEIHDLAEFTPAVG